MIRKFLQQSLPTLFWFGGITLCRIFLSRPEAQAIQQSAQPNQLLPNISIRKDLGLSSINRLIQQQRLADILDLGDGAFQVKSFRQDDLEDLLDVDAVARAAEDEARAHGFFESSGLSKMDLTVALVDM